MRVAGPLVAGTLLLLLGVTPGVAAEAGKQLVIPANEETAEQPGLSKIEQSFCDDFSGVKVHTDGAPQAASKGVGAEAYATGNTVAFKDSVPACETAGHEAAHTVQQPEKKDGDKPSQ